MKKTLIFLIITVGLIFYIGSKCDSCSLDYVTINNQKTAVSVADSTEERITGLSGKEEQSMLFIFDKEDPKGMWMKDMLFSIDIYWISKEKIITHIEKNVSPDTYPEAFIYNALYVLETTVDLINPKVGDSVDL